MSDRLMVALRVASAVVAGVALLALGLRNLVTYRDSYTAVPVQFAAFGLLVAVLAVEAVLLVRRRSWDRRRRTAIAVVLLASAASYLTLTDGVATYQDWAYGTAIWVGAAVLFDRPFRIQVAFLAAHGGVSLANLVLLTDVDEAAVLRWVTGSIGVLGYPLCVAAVAAPLRAVASAAAAAAWEIEQATTAEAIARESATCRRQRIGELADSTLPLLTGLATGALDPADERVRRRCAIEAARMRRLFAELDAVADPLLHELRHCVDVADRKGVLVEWDSRGQRPDLPVSVRRGLTDGPLTALALAESWARVTVVGTAGLVSVNVVADCGAVELRDPDEPGLRLATYTTGDTVWVEVEWRAT